MSVVWFQPHTPWFHLAVGSYQTTVLFFVPLLSSPCPISLFHLFVFMQEAQAFAMSLQTIKEEDFLTTLSKDLVHHRRFFLDYYLWGWKDDWKWANV